MGSCVSVNVFEEEGWWDGLHSMSLVHSFELGMGGKRKGDEGGDGERTYRWKVDFLYPCAN